VDDKILAAQFSDVRKRIDLMDEKLDLILKNCCTHSRTVASMKVGDPVICEDCHLTVGVVR
jgi:hypothetical protein